MPLRKALGTPNTSSAGSDDHHGAGSVVQELAGDRPEQGAADPPEATRADAHEPSALCLLDEGAGCSAVGDVADRVEALEGRVAECLVGRLMGEDRKSTRLNSSP